MPCVTLLAATVFFIATSCLVEAGLAETCRDLTRTPGAYGTEVVHATVALIDEAAIFKSCDNQLLRRIAWVESEDGNKSDTYRCGYFGGIWQVNETMLQQTQNESEVPDSVFKGLEEHFNITWSSVKKEDLLQPLFSALAARIFMEIVDDPIPLASDVQGQANWWEKHYHPGGNTTNFVYLVGALPGCKSRGMDLVFLLDSSGSIATLHYYEVLSFTVDVVRNLTIGPNATQIGLVIFSDDAESQFHLNDYNDKESVIKAIWNTSFLNNKTNTPAGLDLLINEFKNTSLGARPENQGIPRVAIVLTDGRSSAEGGINATIAKAEDLRRNNIYTYAIGVGSEINEDELRAIATCESSMIELYDFDVTDLKKIAEKINYDTCKVPTMSSVGTPINQSLQINQQMYLEFDDIPPTGLTLKIEVDIGITVVFISIGIRNPNEAVYDYKLEISTSLDMFIHMEELEKCIFPPNNSCSIPPSVSSSHTESSVSFGCTSASSTRVTPPTQTPAVPTDHPPSDHRGSDKIPTDASLPPYDHDPLCTSQTPTTETPRDHQRRSSTDLPEPDASDDDTMNRPRTNSSMQVFVVIQGGAEMNNFTLNSTYGDTTVKEDEATGFTSATASTSDTESSASALLMWGVTGGMLLVGLTILIVTIITAIKIKRFTQHVHQRTSKGGSSYVLLEEMQDL